MSMPSCPIPEVRITGKFICIFKQWFLAIATGFERNAKHLESQISLKIKKREYFLFREKFLFQKSCPGPIDIALPSLPPITKKLLVADNFKPVFKQVSTLLSLHDFTV
jgi:hypothetical protein